MKKQLSSLDAVFNPKSVAVTGASPGKQGQLFLDSFLASGYKGKIYAINSKGQEISGLKAYKSVRICRSPSTTLSAAFRPRPCRSSSVIAGPRA